MFGNSGMQMLLGALGIPAEAIEAIPKMAQDFQGLAEAFQKALIDMEERQKRIEAMVTELHSWQFGQSPESYSNGRDNSTSASRFALTHSSGNGDVGTRRDDRGAAG